MKRLWTPWRMRYITAKKSNSCIFCRAFKSRKDKDHYVLFRSNKAFVIMNIYPYSNGHLMVAPKRHVGTLDKLTDNEMLELVRLTKMCTGIIGKTLGPEGLNVGMNIGRVAGAGVPGHVHIHVVPRWTGDTNFMPVLGKIKIIPEALGSTYEKLRKYIPK